MTDFLSLSTAEWEAIQLSLKVAFVAVIVSLPFGIIFAWILARKKFPGKALVETCINIPLVIPPVVTGYLLLITFGSNGTIGKVLNAWFGIQIIFNWKGAALASAIMAFPLMVRSIRLAFISIDTRLEDSAQSLGAKPLKVFWSISLPLARHGIIAGSVLAFARSLGEFGATIMIAGSIPGETQTIPLYIFNLLETPGGMASAKKIIFISIFIAILALFVSEWLERRHQDKV